MSKNVFLKYKNKFKNLNKLFKNCNENELFKSDNSITPKQKYYQLCNPPWMKYQVNNYLISDKKCCNYWKKAFLHRLFKRKNQDKSMNQFINKKNKELNSNLIVCNFIKIYFILFY
jgi:hypothetical protein